VLLAAGSPYIQARMAGHMSYGQAMGSFALVVFLVGAVVIGLGPEERGAKFGRSGADAGADARSELIAQRDG
jgi:hypothetical protein